MTVINVDYSGDVFVSSHTGEVPLPNTNGVSSVCVKKHYFLIEIYTFNLQTSPDPPLSQSHPLLQTYLLRLENILPEIEGGVPLTVELASVFRGKNCSK